MNQPGPNIAQAIVALGFFGLLGFVLWLAVDNYDNFNKAWGLVAPLVGIVIGAIPSYFFREQAAAAEAKVDEKETQVEKKEMQVQTLLEKTDPAVIDQAKAAAPEAWKE